MNEEKVFKAQIFKKGKGISLRINSTRLVIIGFILMFLIPGNYSNKDYVDDPISLLIVLIPIIIIFIGNRWGLSEKQKKHGKLEDELQITDETLVFDNKIYNWEFISNFKFDALEVCDEEFEVIFAYHRYMGGPRYSAGVDNWIEFNYDNQLKKVFFKLEYLSHKIDFIQMMRFQFYSGRIGLTQTYDGLHLEYEEIQQLKTQKVEFKNKKLTVT